MEKEAKPNPLVKERMDKLEELGFNFTVHSDKWMDHWKMLKEYRDKHGHVQVPTHYADNPKLGRWVHTQRHQRRLHQKFKKSCMTEERKCRAKVVNRRFICTPSTWYQHVLISFASLCFVLRCYSRCGIAGPVAIFVGSTPQLGTSARHLATATRRIERLFRCGTTLSCSARFSSTAPLVVSGTKAPLEECGKEQWQGRV
jgi:hypothetical protein